ncbi:hypothetical protein KKG19_04200 [Patescibacteria group bacterium]|nr:hypothetical protein [Patescibacteria group bacterium]
MSPLKYRLSLAKEALFGDNEIIYEVLWCNKNKLPDDVRVSWERDDEWIVGKVNVGGHEYMTQARSAREFVEMVNDLLYAVYEIPHRYAQKLGSYRLLPNKEEFDKLNNAAVKKSSFNFVRSEAVA